MGKYKMVNSVDSSIIYSEVYSILNTMSEKDVKKLPKKFLELIQNKKSESYDPKYDLKRPLKEQNVKQETLAFLALLYLNYWCDSEEEKKELMEQFNENEKKHQEELREKYNPDNLFKKKVTEENKEKTETTSLIEYKETIFQKIINKLKKWFHIN